MVPIPDGVCSDINSETGIEGLSGNKFLRVCVDMTPFLDASCQHRKKRGWSDSSLENWTQYVLGTVKNQISFYYKAPGDKTGASKIPLEAFPALMRSAPDIEKAQKSWKKQFEGQFENLRSLFNATCADQLKTAELREQNKRKNRESFVEFAETDLVEFTQQQDNEDFNFKLLLNAQPSGKQQFVRTNATPSITQQYLESQEFTDDLSKTIYSFEEIAKALTSVSDPASETALLSAIKATSGGANRSLERAETTKAFSNQILSRNDSKTERAIVESNFFKFGQAFNLIQTPSSDPQGQAFVEQSHKADDPKLNETKNASYLPQSDFDESYEDDVEDPVHDAVRRKYAEILSRPTLAQYYGLCLDFYVQIPLSRSGSVLETGFIGCGYKQKLGVAPNWTFFSLSLENNIFVAAEKNGTAQGIVNMTEKTMLRDGTLVPRYGLNEVTLSEVAARLNQAVENQKNYRSGERTAADPFTKTPQEKYGIGLFDRKAREVEAADENSLDLPCRNEFFEADLIDGYRPDIGVLVAVGDPSKFNPINELAWRPLTTAEVFYHDIQINDIQIKSEDKHFGRREDGFVQISSGELRSYELANAQTVKEKEVKIVWEQLFHWTGSGLGVPETERILEDGKNSESQIMEVPTSLGLNANITFKVPNTNNTPDRNLLLPPQRVGMKLYCGMRKRYRFGCGLDVRDAAPLYNPGENILGSKEDGKTAPGTPYHYKRRAKIKSPQVLLLQNDPLITGKTIRGRKNVNPEIKNNSVTTIVFTDEQDEAATRIFVPPRISPDLAEELGMFDQFNLDSFNSIKRLKGAYENDVNRSLSYRLTGEGEFPAALRGEIHLDDNKIAPHKKIVGQALVPIGKSERLRNHDPHFVDPWVTGARIVVNLKSSAYIDCLEKKKILFRKLDLLKEPKIAELERAFDYVKTVPFLSLDNTVGGKGADPIPVALRIIRETSNEGKGHPLVTFNEVKSKKWDPDWKGSKFVPLLEVHIAEGVDAEILVYPEIDWERWSNHHVNGEGVTIKKRVANNQVFVKFEIENKYPKINTTNIPFEFDEKFIPKIFPATKLRAVNAVKKPLKYSNVSLFPVRLNSEPNAFKEWRDKHDNNPQIEDGFDAYKRNLKTLPSEKDSSETFFIGMIKYHSYTTESISVEAQWNEFNDHNIGDEIADFLGKPDDETSDNSKDNSSKTDEEILPWILKPTIQREAIIKITDLPVIYAETPEHGISTIELPLDIPDTTKQYSRVFSHKFSDSQARILDLSVVSTGRFMEYYGNRDELKSKYDEFQNRNESVQRLYIPATQRPKAPKIHHCAPGSKGWRRGKFNKKDKTQKWTRNWFTRIYFESDNRFSAGEGDLIGIVLGPDSGLSLDSDAAKRQMDIYSRWGADNVRGRDNKNPEGIPSTYLLANQLLLNEMTFPQDEFPKELKRNRLSDYKPRIIPASTYSIPSENGEVTAKSEQPSILAIEPRLDKENGLWYIDLHIDSSNFFSPWLQLSAVWVQENAISGAEVSIPTKVNIQTRQQREVEVKLEGHLKRRFIITYKTGNFNLPEIRCDVLERFDSGVRGGNDRHNDWRPIFSEISIENHDVFQPIQLVNSHLDDGTSSAEFVLPFKSVKSSVTMRYALWVEERYNLTNQAGEPVETAPTEMGLFELLDFEKYLLAPGVR